MSSVAGSPCDSDLNGDGQIDGADLGELLAAWGGAGAADLDQSGVVDGGDLGILLAGFGGSCGEPRVVELACIPIDGFPHAEFVTTFNGGSPVWIALDPDLFPDLVGQRVSVFVTDHRTAEEWANDPTLVDVRGGPQPIDVADGGVASNVVQIDDGSLPFAAGATFGIPYDVVVDVNGDGSLGAGDLIDGLGGSGGFFTAANPTKNGPLAVSTETSYLVDGPPNGFRLQRCYYPTDVGTLGELPLVVISHGNGHQYTWYDWLGQHLASWGYIVISHQNNTVPGIASASTTTLEHTEAFIDQHPEVDGGVLEGHLDTDTIVWIGHSRGGEGIVRAYDRIFDGTFTPTNYGAENIVLMASIAPTDFLGTNSANPHSVPYHLIYGAADGDVCGCPNNDVADSFNLFERADAWRQSTYVHGADHNDFNCCGFNDFTGPAGTEIGRGEVQRVARGTFLTVIKNQVEGSIAARDYLFRPYESTRPSGVNPATIVINDLVEPTAPDVRIVDDYQTASSTSESSSGGEVSFDLGDVTEADLNDENTTFTWFGSDEMNGMTRGRPSDDERGVVFSYDAPAFYEWEVIDAFRDLSEYGWLSFRAAQITRHPSTTGNLTFSITLRDGAGVESTVDLASYGASIQKPYARTGFGSGAGWQNEFEVVRLRLRDFVAGNSGLDLADVAAVRLDLGGPAGSTAARMSIDDVMFIRE